MAGHYYRGAGADSGQTGRLHGYYTSCDFQNVDTALTRFADVYSPVFLSGTKYLIYLEILVAGAGFGLCRTSARLLGGLNEPAAFEL